MRTLLDRILGALPTGGRPTWHAIPATARRRALQVRAAAFAAAVTLIVVLVADALLVGEAGRRGLGAQRRGRDPGHDGHGAAPRAAAPPPRADRVGLIGVIAALQPMTELLEVR